MSNKVTFELDTAGVRKNILQADYMLSHIEQEAKNKCPADKHVKAFVGTQRVHAMLYSNTEEHPE